MIDKIRKDLVLLGSKKISLKVNNIRNKTEIINGSIKELYPRLFIFKTEDNLVRSFNYSDLLTGNIEIEGKKYWLFCRKKILFK